MILILVLISWILQEFHVYMMNVEQCLAAAIPQTMLADLGCGLLSSVPTIAMWYYEVKNLHLFCHM